MIFPKTAIVVLFVLLAAAGCRHDRSQPAAGRPMQAEAPEQPALPSTGRPVAVQMRNVNLHILDGVVLEIRKLRGTMVSKVKGRPPVFDDQRSFVLEIDAAEAAMSTASLTRLMNEYVFAYSGSPLKELTITAEDGQLKQKGTLRKGMDVPFTITGDVSITPEGKIRMHPTSIKVVGIPAKGLLELFGVELDELMKVKPERGITIDENDLIMSPDRLLPAPQIRGRLSAVQIQGDRLVQTFGNPQAAKELTPPVPGANYMYYKGGVLRFGKLTMTDADLQIIDADPEDPFDFYPDRYLEQLVAGYSKNTRDLGLKTFMPDFDDLEKKKARSLRPKT